VKKQSSDNSQNINPILLDVDFIGDSENPITEEEKLTISAFIRNSKKPDRIQLFIDQQELNKSNP
jgi:hypothetical protein